MPTLVIDNRLQRENSIARSHGNILIFFLNGVLSNHVNIISRQPNAVLHHKASVRHSSFRVIFKFFDARVECFDFLLQGSDFVFLFLE